MMQSGKIGLILGALLFAGLMADLRLPARGQQSGSVERSETAKKEIALQIIYLPELPRLKPVRIETEKAAMQDLYRFYTRKSKSEKTESGENEAPYPEFFITSDLEKNAPYRRATQRIEGFTPEGKATPTFRPVKKIWRWNVPEDLRHFEFSAGGRYAGHEPDMTQLHVPVAAWTPDIKRNGDPLLLYFDRRKGLLWERHIPVLATLDAVTGLSERWINRPTLLFTEDENIIVALSGIGTTTLFVYDVNGNLNARYVLPGITTACCGGDVKTGLCTTFQIGFSHPELVTDDQGKISEIGDYLLAFDPRRKRLALLTDETGLPLYGMEVQIENEDDLVVATNLCDDAKAMAFDWKRLSAERPPLNNAARQELLRAPILSPD